MIFFSSGIRKFRMITMIIFFFQGSEKSECNYCWSVQKYENSEWLYWWHFVRDHSIQNNHAYCWSFTGLNLKNQNNNVDDLLFRDLKIQNILLTAKRHLRLIDFGLSRMDIFDGDTTNSGCGTPFYMAPEVMCLPPRHVRFLFTSFSS